MIMVTLVSCKSSDPDVQTFKRSRVTSRTYIVRRTSRPGKNRFVREEHHAPDEQRRQSSASFNRRVSSSSNTSETPALLIQTPHLFLRLHKSRLDLSKPSSLSSPPSLHSIPPCGLATVHFVHRAINLKPLS